MRNIIIYLICICLYVLPGFSVEKMSLETCIQTALAHNQNLKALDMKLEIAQKQIRNSQTAYLPKLDLGSYYQYINTVVELQIGPVSKAQGDHDAFGINGNLSQLIFDGRQAHFRSKSLRESKASSLASRQSAAEDLAMNVARLYYGLAGLEKASATLQFEEQTLLDTRKDVENRLNAGLQLPVDLLAIDLQLASLKNRLEDVSNSVKMTTLRLLSLIGLPNDTQIELADEDLAIIPSSAGAIVFNPDRRSSLQTISKQIQAGTYRIKAQQGTFLPMISAKGSYYYENPGIDKFTNDWMNYWTVGINLSWSLWDFHVRSRDTQIAKLETKALQENLDFATDQARLQFDEASLNTESSRRQISLSEKQVDLAEKKLQKTRDKYNSGLATSTELITAVNDWESAKLTQAKSIIQSRMNELELKYATGDILK